jgi:hypothetical protein
MTESQRAEWRRALAVLTKGRRGQRGRHQREPRLRPGMIRRPAPKEPADATDPATAPEQP